MPELPEIETLRTALRASIVNQTISAIHVRRRDLRFDVPRDLSQRFKQSTVVGVRRRSKYLLIDFDHGYTLIVHLGMSGRLFLTEASRSLDKHDHVTFDFAHGLHMRFRDPRRFGLIDYCDTSRECEHRLFQHLGFEPLDDEFQAQQLMEFCAHSKSAIKSLIMNARNVVGVGNIYANEALFASGLHPATLGCDVNKRSATVLCEQIKTILKNSIALGGTSFKDYVSLNEEPGLHQLHLRVYGQEGRPCPQCQSPIQRLIQSNRSSFYCAVCQKL